MGKLLTIYSLNYAGISNYKLENLLYNNFNRPYFSTKFDFNISHSNQIITCLIGENINLGVDVEKKCDIDLNYFYDQFTKNEIMKIENSATSINEFYKIWTRKESVAKADGRGMNILFKGFDVLNNTTHVGDKTWYLETLCVLEDYSISIASNKDIIKKTRIICIDYNELINNSYLLTQR